MHDIFIGVIICLFLFWVANKTKDVQPKCADVIEFTDTVTPDQAKIIFNGVMSGSTIPDDQLKQPKCER